MTDATNPEEATPVFDAVAAQTGFTQDTAGSPMTPSTIINDVPAAEPTPAPEDPTQIDAVPATADAPASEPIVDAPSEPVVDPAPAEPTPVDAPSEPVVDPAPAEPTPVDAPSEPVVDPAPAEPVVDPAPAEPTPVEEEEPREVFTETVTETLTETVSESEHREYSVMAGDTLSGIADRLHIEGGGAALYAANKDVIGSDPNNITPGQVLVLP